MKILLDTHVFLWAISDDTRLSASYRELFVDSANDLFLSVASVWEVSIKAGLGKLLLPGLAAPYLAKHMDRNRVQMLGIQLAHLTELEQLPPLHRDPFDRMIAAQARSEAMAVMSADRKLAMYGVRVL